MSPCQWVAKMLKRVWYCRNITFYFFQSTAVATVFMAKKQGPGIRSPVSLSMVVFFQHLSYKTVYICVMCPPWPPESRSIVMYRSIALLELSIFNWAYQRWVSRNKLRDELNYIVGRAIIPSAVRDEPSVHPCSVPESENTHTFPQQLDYLAAENDKDQGDVLIHGLLSTGYDVRHRQQCGVEYSQRSQRQLIEKLKGEKKVLRFNVGHKSTD